MDSNRLHRASHHHVLGKKKKLRKVTGTMSGLQCLTCLYEYLDHDDLRAHQKSEWHRHNLKRRLANLPPFSQELFEELQAQKDKSAKESKPQSVFCEACNKPFKTKAAYENHLPSKHHKDAEEKQERRRQRLQQQQQNKKNQEKGMEEKPEASPSLKDLQMSKAVEEKEEEMEAEEGDDSDAESWESWEDEPLAVGQCLFCSLDSGDVESNVEHMTSKHSLFLPDADFLVDLTGLIQYLGEKVGVGHRCLWCGDTGKSFHTVDAVQKHMQDKGHCRILFDGLFALEYADFYDYRKSYPDDPRGQGDGEEEAPGMRQLPTEDSFELHLPSGATIGHRSLQRYYRQNMVVCGRNESSKSMVSKLLAKYKALGWTGTTGTVAVQQRKDLAYMQRLKHQRRLDLGIKANKLQRHFRSQNPI